MGFHRPHHFPVTGQIVQEIFQEAIYDEKDLRTTFQKKFQEAIIDVQKIWCTLLEKFQQINYIIFASPAKFSRQNSKRQYLMLIVYYSEHFFIDRFGKLPTTNQKRTSGAQFYFLNFTQNHLEGISKVGQHDGNIFSAILKIKLKRPLLSMNYLSGKIVPWYKFLSIDFQKLVLPIIERVCHGLLCIASFPHPATKLSRKIFKRKIMMKSMYYGETLSPV